MRTRPGSWQWHAVTIIYAVGTVVLACIVGWAIGEFLL